ncbi:transglutaminase-like cysteine peptidase [Salinarimonas soli]|uniref:Transglutaminase-like cysteine peptidase n=1 Tax=Salinarimonas soli TaxID=1638099 RepID=A0A5B2V900_9HYPH|nr:transglutaminase-like cysteine peptidase [Salinarimonas soli]KAA2235296.1 transglutaminase-like cysteine peptidase [Salinarimonas soli]
MRSWWHAAMLAALVLAPAGAGAETFAHAGPGTAAPPAFGAFCRSHPGQCARVGPLVERIALTPARLAELRSVNASVNGAIREMGDLEHHGVEDHWSLAEDGRGDCEDFALLKRKMLIERGWPSSVLLMTTVSTPSGEGHAVLSVITDGGDLVLDNKTGAVLPWTGTGYAFYTRQSQRNPRAWVWIDHEPPAALAARAPRKRTTLAQ